MPFTAFRGMKPFSRLLFAAFTVLAVFLVFQIAATVVAIPIFGFKQVAGLVNGFDITDQVTISMLKYFQVIQAVGLFIVPSFLTAWMLYENWAECLYLNRPVSFTAAILVILLILVVNPFINFTGALNSEMHLPQWFSGIENWMRNAEDEVGKLTDAFVKVNTIGGLLFNLFMIAILPALGEELLFRGVIQRIIMDWTRNHHLGIWLSAALFSALHMQFFGFVPRILLGAMFGYMLVWSGSLWLPILAHFVNNAGAVIALYLVDKGIISSSVEEFGSGMEYWYYAVPSLAIGILILWAIKYQFNNQEVKTI